MVMAQPEGSRGKTPGGGRDFDVRLCGNSVEHTFIESTRSSRRAATAASELLDARFYEIFPEGATWMTKTAFLGACLTLSLGVTLSSAF